jgi:CBS domain containing-hemolysin-like protein
MEKIKNILHRITESYAFLLFVMTLSQSLNFIFKSLLKLSGGKQYKRNKNTERDEEEILGI